MIAVYRGDGTGTSERCADAWIAIVDHAKFAPHRGDGNARHQRRIVEHDSRPADDPEAANSVRGAGEPAAVAVGQFVQAGHHVSRVTVARRGDERPVDDRHHDDYDGDHDDRNDDRNDDRAER